MDTLFSLHDSIVATSDASDPPTLSLVAPNPDFQSVKELISKTYATYVPNTKPDKKLVTYWSNIIAKGDRSISDFNAYLAKHTDYLNAIKSVFVDMFYEHLSGSMTSGGTYQEMFDAMLASVSEDKLLTVDDVWAYLSHTHEFTSEYQTIITRMFQSIFGSTPSDAELRLCIDRIREDKHCTIDMVQKDVETFYARGMHKVAASALVTTGLKKGDGDDDAVADGVVVQGSGGGSAFGAAPPKIPEGIAPDLELVDQYEEVFKRPMNVREYILYIHDLRAHRGDLEFIEGVYQKQSAYYKDIMEIMHVFLDKYISEDQFLAHYLAKIYDPSYIDTLRSEVINSKEYTQKMTKKLQSLYRNMYGELMSQEDVEYLFERIKAQEVGLNDDSLNERVAEFRVENDDVVQRIFDIFFDVLDREPDIHEQNATFRYIRQHIGEDKVRVNEQIALDLKDSLEYHDVLKRKISKVYTKHCRDVLFPSKMYHVLNKVLPMKHLSSIDTYIEEVVTEMLEPARSLAMVTGS
jgi:hypothetical protein